MEPYRPQLSFDLELPLMQTAEEICPFTETRQPDGEEEEEEEEEEDDDEEEEEEEEEEVENPSDMVHPSVSNNAPLQVEIRVEGEAGGGGAIAATQQADRNFPSKLGHGLVLQPLPASNPPPHHELSDEGVYPVRHASHGVVVQDKGLFIEALRSFLPAIGVRLIIPRLGGQELDLHSLYKEVTCRGGLEQVTKYKKWKEITSSLDILHSSRNASFVLRKHYINLLYHFEQSYYFGVQGRLVPPPAPLPAPCSTESNACKIPDGDSTAIKRKRKMDFNGIFEADPVVSIGNTVSGAINGKVEEGYMVTVVIGGERMSGCMYVVPCDTIPEQYATVPGLLGGASSKKVEVRGGEKVQTPPKIRRVHRKDTDIPKNTRSGYNLFCRELRAKRKLMPRGRSNEPRKSVYELWRRLPEEEKIVYRERGNGEREKQKKESKEKTDLESRKGEAILSIMPESDSAYDYHVSLDAVTAPLEHNMNEEGCLNENLSQEQASDSENSHQEYQNDEPLSEVDADGGSPQAIAEDGENAYHVKIPSPTMEENMGVINNTHYIAGPNYAYPSQMHPSHLTGALVGNDHDMRYEAPENGRTYRSPLPILHNAHNSSMIPPEQMYYAQNGFVHAAKAHCEQGPALSQQGYRPQGSWLPHVPAYGPNHISNEEMYRPHGGGGIPQGGGGIPQGGGGIPQGGGGIPQGVNFHGEQGIPSSEQGFRPQGGGFPPPIHRGQSSTSLEQYYGSLPYRMNAHHEQMYMPQGSGGLPYYPSMQHPMPPPPDSNPQNREMHFKHSYPPDAFPYPMHLPSRPPPGGGYLVQSPYGLHYPHPHPHAVPHPHPHPHAVPYAVHPHAALHYGGGYMNQYSMPRDVPPSVAGGSAPVQFPSQAQEGGYPLPAKEGSERQ